MGITKIFCYLITEDGLCFNVRVHMPITRKTNKSRKGIFQCVVGDDLFCKGRGSLCNFIHVKIAHLLLSLSLEVAFVGKARK